MEIAGLLLGLAVACAAVAVVAAMRLAAGLDRRGMKTPFPFVGALLFRNLIRYRDITRQETGQVGPLFYGYIISINAALLLAIAAWLTRALR